MKIIIPLLALCGLAVVLLYPATTPSSPRGPAIEKESVIQQEYIVLGFVPYWLKEKVTSQAIRSITHYAYFALLLDEQGEIYTHANPREQEPGYTNYQRLLKDPPKKPLILTFMPVGEEALVSIVSSTTSRTRAVRTIRQVIAESRASGVNIDFEPLGNTSASVRNNFTLFVKELSETLKPNNHTLDISVYASAASRPRLWDLEALAPSTDHFVIMTYDYTLPSDGKTGPNSPLRGAGQLFEHDIVKNLAEISKQVAPQKILLGIPFYGYEWEVTSTDKYALAEGRGAVASLERVDELARGNTLELLWDRNSLTPYAVRREEGEVVSQIYYENESSVKLKLDLVKNAELGGIAIWALGYEGSNPGLWHTIDSLQR